MAGSRPLARHLAFVTLTGNTAEMLRQQSLVNDEPWYEKACAETISNRITSSVICRRRSGCGRIIRCAPSERWWAKYLLDCRARCDVPSRGPSVDFAEEAVAGAVAADVVLDPQRATADGRDGLQPVVPLVCGAERR